MRRRADGGSGPREELEADLVIVGGGSAGAVLASRLSEDAGRTVVLLEAGGETGRDLFVNMPSAFSIAMARPRLNWGFRSEPEQGLGGRRLDCPRGRGLGGSSAINGMVYVRGHACDFDEWGRLGAEGWDYASCLPYFRRAETWAGGADDYRGGAGPLGVGLGNGMRLNPLYEAFIRAGLEAGYDGTPDYNGARQEGFGAMHMTVADGRRVSAARAYLTRAVRRRPNLRIVTGCVAERLLWDGRRARGVLCRRGGRGGVALAVVARDQVVLSAGAIGTPALLQRSGVGAPGLLGSLGIAPVAARPGVGANLQDHLEIYFQHRCREPITLNGQLHPLGRARIGLRWLLRRDGLGATNHFESCGFIRSDKGVAWPDIQYHFLPAAVRYDGRAAFKGHGFQVHVGPNKPASRGEVAIAGPDPRVAPRILFRYITDPRDREDWRKAVRLTREILGQPALDRWRAEELQPGAEVRSDAAIDAWVRANAESAYHPSCTCKMGSPDDPWSVADGQCRVFGVEGVRVVDSSVFPTIPNGNLNAPTIMVAERMSDVIRGRTPLREERPWSGDPEWATRQRPRRPARPVPA